MKMINLLKNLGFFEERKGKAIAKMKKSMQILIKYIGGIKIRKK